MSKKPTIRPYHEPAGGLGATAATFEHLIDEPGLAAFDRDRQGNLSAGRFRESRRDLHLS